MCEGRNLPRVCRGAKIVENTLLTSFMDVSNHLDKKVFFKYFKSNRCHRREGKMGGGEKSQNFVLTDVQHVSNDFKKINFFQKFSKIF